MCTLVLRYTFFLVSALICFAVSAQAPILLTNFNPGDPEAIDGLNNTAVALDGALLFPIIREDIGQEIGVLRDGVLELLIDLYPGAESSQATELTVLGDRVYFSGRDDNRAAGIWGTDGTEEGTTLIFRPTSNTFENPRGLIAAKSGRLYFSHNSQLYSYSEMEGVQALSNNVVLQKLFNQQEFNYTRYGEEIAFIRKDRRSTDFDLMTIRDGVPVRLASSSLNNSSGEIYALHEVRGGLIFAVDDTDIEQNFIFDAQDSVLREYPIAGTDNFISRSIDLSDTTILSWIRPDGVFSANGNEAEDALVHTSMPSVIVSGTALNNLVIDGEALFVGADQFGDEKSIVRSDGTASGTEEIFRTDSEFISNMVSDGRYVYLADGISNRFIPSFYRVDLESNQWNKFYTAELPAPVNSIVMLGVLDNRLYFGGWIEAGVGREVYYFELDKILSSENPIKESSHYTLINNEYGVELRSEYTSPIGVRIFDQQGRLRNTIETTTNIPIHLNDDPEILFIHVEGPLGRAVYKIGLRR